MGNIYIGLYKLNRDFTSITGEGDSEKKHIMRKDDPVMVYADIHRGANPLYYVDLVDKTPLKILIPLEFIDLNISGLIDAMADRLYDISRILDELISNRIEEHSIDADSKKMLNDAVENIFKAKDNLDNFSNIFEKSI
jgi:hypothetical protein